MFGGEIISSIASGLSSLLDRRFTYVEIKIVDNKMDWKNLYPTVADVNQASFETLYAWDDNLPPPQCDVEQTVRRKIRNRQLELADKEARKTTPEVVKKRNELEENIRSIGLGSIGRM